MLRQRRRRARALGPATFLIDRVAGDLADRLAAVLRPFGLAADLGSPSGAVRRALAARVGTMVAVDASAQNLADHDGPKVVADEEALPFAEASLDLVVSGLALQSVNDLPGTLVQVRRALKPDGLFLA
ncbi:MAG TPA: methyltransferase domain-containing protein, partial [Xanthobacteraceae bacterium]